MISEDHDLPVDGILDLHAFSPREVKDLVPHYLEVCRERGIFQVRIIHGKGRGTLRETVHSLLRKDPSVVSYGLDQGGAGSWGATIVILAPPPSSSLPATDR
jgi:DNA-nicking Smr family endonuclease